MSRRMESEGGSPSPPCLRRYGKGTVCPCPEAASTFLCWLLASLLPVSLFLSSLPPTWPSLLWPRGPLRQLHACPTITVPQGVGTCCPPCPRSYGSFPRLPHTLVLQLPCSVRPALGRRGPRPRVPTASFSSAPCPRGRSSPSSCPLRSMWFFCVSRGGRGPTCPVRCPMEPAQSWPDGRASEMSAQ